MANSSQTGPSIQFVTLHNIEKELNKQQNNVYLLHLNRIGRTAFGDYSAKSDDVDDVRVQ